MGWGNDRLVVLLVSSASAASCKAYNQTGTSYDDPNITVIEGIKSTMACCDAAAQYNLQARQQNKPAGKIAVWWRDFSLCLVKASAIPYRKSRKLSVGILC